MRNHQYLIAISIFWILISCNPQQHRNNGEKDIAKAVLLSDGMKKAFAVYLTTDEKSQPVASWVEEDSSGKKYFYFAKWLSEENKFAEAKEIPIAQNAATHEEGMPKIAFESNGSIMAIYEASTPHAGHEWGVGDIFYMLSNDSGKTWSAPASVNKQKSEDASLSFSGIARLSDGEIGVAWLDANPEGSDQPGRPVLFARTEPEHGFGKPVLIEKTACECCRVAVTSGEDGHIAVAFRDLQDENVRDISISRSFDGGETFTKPNIFSHDGWKINGCPHNGPSLAAANGKIYAVWYSGGEAPGLHYAELDSEGNLIKKKSLSENAQFASIAIMSNGTSVIAYNEKYKENDTTFSRIVLRKISGKGDFIKKINSPEKQGSFPMVQPIDQSSVLFAWRDGAKIYYDKIKIEDIDEKRK